MYKKYAIGYRYKLTCESKSLAHYEHYTAALYKSKKLFFCIHLVLFPEKCSSIVE